MLASLPIWIRILLLMGAGAVFGAFINWAIYAWTIWLSRPISPWMTPVEGESPRIWQDRIPVAGWYLRRRDSQVYGTGFWIRPMLIELTWIIGVPWFYHWQTTGGLTGGVVGAPNWNELSETWFYAHTILFGLMFIGTFIDFDEKTIPDQVTIPGTLIGLTFAALADWSRLPEIVTGMAAVPSIESIHPASPGKPDFLADTSTMMIAMVIFSVWVWALLPKIDAWHYGLRKTIRFMIAYPLQPKRKTKCEIRIQNRKTPTITIFLGVLLFSGLAALYAAWNFLPAENVHSLYGAMIGLAFGGGMIWAIRIIGSLALGQEAMGFGDVTLMAMIGSFVGWQASLMAFVFSPFAALFVALTYFIIRRENEIAFGPYLCIGTTFLLFGWSRLWPNAAAGVFALGPLLLYVFAASLVLMAIMLAIIAGFKNWYSGEVVDS